MKKLKPSKQRRNVRLLLVAVLLRCSGTTFVRQVTLAALTNAEVNDFRKEVARRMLLPPWDAYIKSNINVS